MQDLKKNLSDYKLEEMLSLTKKINEMQIQILVVYGEETYGDFDCAVHIYDQLSMHTRRFYCREDAKEFLLGMLTAFESMP